MNGNYNNPGGRSQAGARVLLLRPDGKSEVPIPPENLNPDPDPEVIWRLIRQHVPEVTSGIVKIQGFSRHPGKRSVVAVSSNQRRVDAVGTFVGRRGERVKRMIAELRGEKIDVLLWTDSVPDFIANLVAPLRVVRLALDEASRKANVTVTVSESRLPDLALRSDLLMDLTGWKLKVEFSKLR